MAVLCFGVLSVCLVKPCNDINSAKLLSENSEYTNKTLTSKIDNPMLLKKAETVQYNLIESSLANSDSTVEKTSLVTSQPKKSYSNETITVYDLNTGKRVTLNCFDAVCQIVRNEVGSYYHSGAKAGQTAYHKETIKAHAVAAYTYLKYNSSRGAVANVGLNSDVPQVIKNYVREVDGQAIYYNNSYICAVYSASTGGYTLSSKNAWGTNNPYLQSVVSKYDSRGPQYSSVITIPESKVKQMVEYNTGIKLTGDPINWIRVASVIDGNYVDSVIINGNSTCRINGRDRKITGSLFRERIIGFNNLRSAAFTVHYDKGNFHFTSYGFGHGIGLSSEGAEQYAKFENWNYVQILKHYYTDVKIL